VIAHGGIETEVRQACTRWRVRRRQIVIAAGHEDAQVAIFVIACRSVGATLR